MTQHTRRTRIGIEVAVDSVDDALKAQGAGATRLELCTSLVQGGLTPSAGLVTATVRRVELPVFVLVRPREGDFLYTASEIDVMLRDVEAARAAGAHGIVSGALNANGTIDEDGVRALQDAASPLPFTFHRAVDFSRDVEEAVDRLAALGVQRVLTSGGAENALQGRHILKRIVERSAAHLQVLAGGGIRAANALEILNATGVREIHLGPRRAAVSGMRHRASAPRVTKGSDANIFEWGTLDDDEVRRTADVTQHAGVAP